MIDLTVIGKFPRKSGKFHRKQKTVRTLFNLQTEGRDHIKHINERNISYIFRIITRDHNDSRWHDRLSAIRDRVTSPTSTKVNQTITSGQKRKDIPSGNTQLKTATLMLLGSLNPIFLPWVKVLCDHSRKSTMEN